MLKLAVENGVEKFMSIMCRHMNNIGGEFTLEETDDEIVVMGNCGTGGRYIREGEAEFNEEGISYYCVHCPIWWEEIPKEFGLDMSFEIGDQGIGCAFRLKK